MKMGKFIACLLGGWFGLHKFMEKKTGLGILYLCTMGLFTIGWFVDCIIYLVKWLSESKQPAAVTKEPESPYIFLVFRVAGVTFKNGRKHRQSILRALHFGDEEIETVTLEPYEWEGKPAVYVMINDQIIGSIPAVTVDTFYEHERNYKRDNIHAVVYGTTRLENGEKGNYGCEITIRYIK